MKDTGAYEILSIFSSLNNIQIHDMESIIDGLNSKVINKINTILNNKLIVPCYLDINGKISEMKIRTTITVNDKLCTKEKALVRLKSNVFFTFIKQTEDGALLLKYKRVSNSVEMDGLTSFINQNYNCYGR
jgi:hypothetical protein